MDFSRLNLTPNMAPFVVALITWIGVFLYLLRLEKLTRQLEREVERAAAHAAQQNKDE